MGRDAIVSRSVSFFLLSFLPAWMSHLHYNTTYTTLKRVTEVELTQSPFLYSAYGTTGESALNCPTHVPELIAPHYLFLSSDNEMQAVMQNRTSMHSV